MPHNPKIERKLKVAQLLASGLSKQAIADMEGLNRSTIHLWSQEPMVIAEVERLRNELIENTREVLKAEVQNRAATIADQIREYGERRRNTAIQLQSIAVSLLEKLAVRVNTLDHEEITLRNLGSLLQATAEVIEKGSAAEADALGIEEMMSVLKAKGLLESGDGGSEKE